MWRCKKVRVTSQSPDCLYFKPLWETKQKCKEIEVMPDEFEAIKLADVDGLDMKSWAKQMNISTSTFYRILSQARKKIWTAITSWLAIKICPCTKDF